MLALVGGARGETVARAVRVRAAAREDVPRVHRMLHVYIVNGKSSVEQELAAHEGVADKCKITVEGLLEDGFDSSPAWFFLLVAEEGAELVGYALCNRAYCSWTRRAFYIEDLYVRPSHRHAGVGELLFKEICRLGVAAGVHRIDGHVLESNAPARAFYARLGARDMRVSEGRAAMRLHRAHIERLAADLCPTHNSHSPLFGTRPAKL